MRKRRAARPTASPFIYKVVYVFVVVRCFLLYCFGRSRPLAKEKQQSRYVARRRKRDDVSARRRPAVQNFAPALREILDEHNVLVLVCVYGLFLPELAETAALAALQS